MPVTVTAVSGSTSMVVNCGLDTFLGGYPDAAVQGACRSHYQTHAEVALGLAGFSFLIAGAGIRLSGLQRRKSLQTTVGMSA
jgi:hypothetical protein